MVLGSRNRERFWIALTVRFGFGFLFLIAAINILFLEWSESKTIRENFENIPASLQTFADIQSKYYETSWMNFKVNTGPVDPITGAGEQTQIGMMGIKLFLKSMPFVFLGLSVFLLTGIFWRLALRLSAFYLVMLGIGKYVVDFRTGQTLTTLQDFTFAMFIFLALFILSREDSDEDEAAGLPPGR